jgi:hypothetical protein
MRANFGEAGGNLRGLPAAESRESLFETEVRSWHDREIDYTAGHDIVCPHTRKSPAKMPALHGYASFFSSFFCGGAAALAVATSEVNAAASFTAISASTLRSSATPAAFRP